MGIRLDLTEAAAAASAPIGYSPAQAREVQALLDEHGFVTADMFKSEATHPVLQGQAYVGGQGGTGGMAPLLMQSIQATLDDASFGIKHIVLWGLLKKTIVSKSTNHEATRINAKGSSQVDFFINDGGIGTLSEAEFERLVVAMKYFAEYVEVPDTAAVLQGLGPDPTVLATRQRLAIVHMLGKLERYLVEGDTAASELQFDGLRAQIRRGAPKNYHDLEGELPSAAVMEEAVGFVQSEEAYGVLTHCLTSPRVRRLLSTLEIAFGRNPKDKGGSAQASYIGGPGKLFLTSDYDDIEILGMPHISWDDKINVAALGGSGAPSGISLNGGFPTVNAPDAAASTANGGARWRTKDLGEYWYKFVPVGDHGTGAPITVGPVNITTAGQSVSFSFNDDSKSYAKDTDGMLRYYRVWRTEKDPDDETDITQYGYIGQFARGGSSGTPADTVWVDQNFRRPFCRPILLLELTEECMYWCQLMDMVRRPLGQTKTSIPFLLYMMGTPFVKLPTHCYIIDNARQKL